jgi:hypothetical protein
MKVADMVGVRRSECRMTSLSGSVEVVEELGNTI